MIEKCTNKGNIHGYNNVGGIVGRAVNNSKIQNCLNTSEIYQEGEEDINFSFGTEISHDLAGICGGIVGRLENSTIENCANTDTATIYGLSRNTTYGYVIGGIVGVSEKNSTILKCKNKGNLMRNSLSTKENGEDYMGGIAGITQETTIDQCFNTGLISGEQNSTYYSWCIGGISGGSRETNISNCYNTGSVYGGKGSAGGIVGTFNGSANEKNNTIYNCYSITSDIIASTAGTFIGYSSYLQGDYVVGKGNTLGARRTPPNDTWGTNEKVYSNTETWDGSEIFTYMNQEKGKDLWEFKNGFNDNLPYLKNNKP